MAEVWKQRALFKDMEAGQLANESFVQKPSASDGGLVGWRSVQAAGSQTVRRYKARAERGTVQIEFSRIRNGL